MALVLAACTREPPPAVAGATIEIPGAKFELPSRWQRQTPASNLRVAQAQVPGDGGPAELAVFHFGQGQGGGVEANLQRWIGQMDPAPGAAPERDSFQTNGCNVTWVDVTGTLKPGQMGMGPAAAQPDSRLLAAVVEGPGGPWFFRLTGRRATVTPARDDFMQMLRTVEPRQG